MAFLIKLWNASGFVSNLLSDYTPDEKARHNLQPLDLWILSKTERLVEKVTDALEKCQFNTAIEETRNFTWHVFCDSYLEAAKDRLYRPEVHGDEKKRAAQYTLHSVLNRILLLLAPMIPHVTEEIYQNLYADEQAYKSIHRSKWPPTDKGKFSEESEKRGDLLIAIISEIRREKAEKHLPLNAPIKSLAIYAPNDEVARTIDEGKEDIQGTCKVNGFHVLTEKGRGNEVKPFDISFVATYD